MIDKVRDVVGLYTERGHVFFELNTGTEAFAPATFSNFTRAFCVSSRAATPRR